MNVNKIRFHGKSLVESIFGCKFGCRNQVFVTIYEITIATKESIVPLIIGDELLWKSRIGRELVTFFQNFGFRDDVYNQEVGGLSRIGDTKLNSSKKTYTTDRLRKLDDKKIQELIEKLINESNDKEKAVDVINKILKPDNIILDLDAEDIKWQGIDSPPDVQNKASFEKIENKVIDTIKQAKVSILVAMAWFTNENIKSALEAKRIEGLQIEIIIYKDGVNANHGVDLSDFDCSEIRGTKGGIMHNKFCVLDNQRVIIGSYNWSTNAEYKNNENVIITSDNKIATEYSVEFRKLKPLI